MLLVIRYTTTRIYGLEIEGNGKLTARGSYVINLVTTLSISAISSNGTVRGGGAYYLISRSLGPEFGGSIGLVFYLGFVFNTGMNAVGMVDCLINNFGKESGSMARIFPESFVRLMDVLVLGIRFLMRSSGWHIFMQRWFWCCAP